MGQNLRFGLLFLVSLNRMIIEKYGGETNGQDLARRNFTELKTSENFCDSFEVDWFWSPKEGFGWERANFWYFWNLLICLSLFTFIIRSSVFVTVEYLFYKSVI